MATIGYKDIKVTDWDTLRFVWRTISQSIAANTSEIYWILELVSDEYGAINSNSLKTWSVKVDGKDYSGYNSIDIANTSTKILASGYTTITHNTDGTKTFSYSFSQYFGITFSGSNIGTISGSGTGELEPIGGGATITSAPNFTDEDNPTITYNNPMGSMADSVQVCISSDGYKIEAPYRVVSLTGDSYTFNLTNAERDALREAVKKGSSTTVYFYIKTYYGGSWGRPSRKAVTFSIVNGTPTLSPTVIDNNSITKGLTGNSNVLIKNASTAYFNVNGAGRKGATIASTLTRWGAANTSTAANGTIEKVVDNEFKFTVTDSRGNTATQTVTKTMINYFKPTCQLKIYQPKATDTFLYFEIKGKMFNGSFGAVSNAAIFSYRYKVNQGTYSAWASVVPTTASNGEYIASAMINNTDYKNTYTIQARITDKLYTIETPEEDVLVTPVFDWGKEDFNFNVPVSVPEVNLTGDGVKGENVAITAENDLSLNADGKVYINGRAYGTNSVLWVGASHMNASQVVTLSKKVSEQPNGIVLVFSLYRNGASENVSMHSFFVSKQEVVLFPKAPHTFFLSINAGFSTIGAKYIYIDDTGLYGHEGNTQSGSNNGITFNNSSFVLRAVIGV